MLELANKGFKVVIITVFFLFRKLSSDMQTIKKKTQIKFIEIKTARSEKNKLDRIKNRLDTAEQKISELEDITIKTTQGASLVVQWLRICLPMQRTRVRALVWENPTCRGATGPVSHNY